MDTIFGTVDPPWKTINPISGYNSITADPMNSLLFFASNVIKLLLIGAGIFAFVNLLMAGLQFISSGSNPDSVTQAWQKIYMSLIGLVVMVAAFAIAAILGILLFQDATAILSPKLYGPGTEIWGPVGK